MELQKAPSVLVYSLLRLVVHYLKIGVLPVATSVTLLFSVLAFMIDTAAETSTHVAVTLSLNYIQPLSTVETQAGHVTVLDLVAVDVVLLVRYLVARLP